MSERNAIELPGSADPMPPELWSVDEADLPLMRYILEMSGVDMSAPDIDKALATARLVPLPEAAVAELTAEERLEYEHEQKYYAGWSLPNPTDLQKRIYNL